MTFYKGISDDTKKKNEKLLHLEKLKHFKLLSCIKCSLCDLQLLASEPSISLLFVYTVVPQCINDALMILYVCILIG